MNSITSRDKKSLVVGGTFIILYLLFIFIAKPKYHESLLVNQKIQDKIIFIQKYYEVLSQKDYYKAKGEENKSINIMDVNQDAIKTIMSDYQVDLIIHGHTHRPAKHSIERNNQHCERFVLGDWTDDSAIILDWSNEDPILIDLIN